MKKFASILLTSVVIASLMTSICGCSKNSDKKTSPNDGSDSVTSIVKDSAKGSGSEDEDKAGESEHVVDVETSAPTTIQIRALCQLATTEVYYHDVCKGVKSPGTGLSHLGEQEREFWFEYTAEATLGIDFSKVELLTNGNTITVYYPHAEIIGNIRIDSESTTEPICGYEGFFQNTNYITADDVTAALADANNSIRAEIESDPTLYRMAEARAEELITNYIDQIMAQSGVKYTVKFEYIDKLR